MSRKARSRALLRNLRKQARKGNLSALERKQLLQQEKRFRKGRGGFRKGLGAGLGAGVGIAAAKFLTSPAFKTLLESRPTVEELMKRMRKEGVPEGNLEEVANTVQDAGPDATASEIVQEVEEQVAPTAEDAAPAEERGQTAGLLDSLGAMEGPAPARGVSDPAMDRSIFDNDPLDPSSARLQSNLDGVVQNPEAMTPALFDEREAVFADPERMGATRPQPRSITGELLTALGEDDRVGLRGLGAVSGMTPLSEVLDGTEGRSQSQVLLDQLDLSPGDMNLDEEEEDFPVDFDPIMSRPSGLRDSRPGEIQPDGTRGPRVPIDTTPRALEGDELRDEVARRQAARAADAEMRESNEIEQRIRREGGYDPRTGEYRNSDRQQRIDDEFDRDFERSAFTDEERAAEAENARLDALDRARDAAVRASTIYPGFDVPAPNDGTPVFGELEELGQRPRLTGPNNPVSRRVNVDDPGLRLPIVDIPMEPENLYDLQEEITLENQRRGTNSGIPLRRGRRPGPRVQAMGGKNPKMADLMKKVKAKYGIR